MDLMTLDSNQQPAKMVELYDSLIWTERYATCGDFQITTGNVDQFMTMLPEGTLLGLRESTVPMIVESHFIERKKGQPVKLTIKGREFTSILDRRISARTDLPGTQEWTVLMQDPIELAYWLIYEVCVAGMVSPLDVFPSSLVQFVYADSGTSTSPYRNFTVSRGNLLALVQQYLATSSPLDTSTTPNIQPVEPHGIRAVRPPVGSTAIQLQIYKGTDKSASVYFDATRDLLDDGSYLFSKVGSATDAVCISNSAVTQINSNGTAPSGMDRRVILVDGSNSNLDASAIFENGKTSLAECKQTALFDGSINVDLNPYDFNVDYGLGDIVKLVGDYGLSGSARVTEYIRSEDNTGSKAYPTLTTIVT